MSGNNNGPGRERYRTDGRLSSGRRRFLRLTGGALVGGSLLGTASSASAATNCADGPFEIPVIGPETVNGRSLRASGSGGGGGSSGSSGGSGGRGGR